MQEWAGLIFLILLAHYFSINPQTTLNFMYHLQPWMTYRHCLYQGATIWPSLLSPARPQNCSHKWLKVAVSDSPWFTLGFIHAQNISLDPVNPGWTQKTGVCNFSIEPSVNPETLENAINGDNYDPQTALPVFFLVPVSIYISFRGVWHRRRRPLRVSVFLRWEVVLLLHLGQRLHQEEQ